jgi:hypothetical protein
MLERMREPSTWAGLGLIVQSVGPLVVDYKNPVAWLSFVGGAFAVWKREGK